MTCFLSFLRHVRPSLIVCGLALSIGIATSAATTLGQEAAKAKSLFDGKTLAGWSGLPSNWRVEDGAITGQKTTPSSSTRSPSKISNLLANLKSPTVTQVSNIAAS